MKVRDLMEILKDCGPDTDVYLTIPVEMVERRPKEANDAVELAFEPVVQPMWNHRSCDGPATSLYIGLPENAG